MPRYDYQCDSCNYIEELFVDSESPRSIKCPNCHNENSFNRLIGTPTMIGAPKTLGSLAEANSRKMRGL